MDALQRAAGGGIAVSRTWSEWASEGGLKGKVGEPENRLRYQRKHMSVCVRGCSDLHQAGWHRRSYFEITALVPANVLYGTRAFCFARIPKQKGEMHYETGKL